MIFAARLNRVDHLPSLGPDGSTHAGDLDHAPVRRDVPQTQFSPTAPPSKVLARNPPPSPWAVACPHRARFFVRREGDFFLSLADGACGDVGLGDFMCGARRS